jgi:hypothetical protein
MRYAHEEVVVTQRQLELGRSAIPTFGSNEFTAHDLITYCNDNIGPNGPLRYYLSAEQVMRELKGEFDLKQRGTKPLTYQRGTGQTATELRESHEPVPGAEGVF